MDVKLDGTTITVKGPKGQLTRSLHKDMIVQLETEHIVNRPSEGKEHRALHGLTRTLVANMVKGVTTGYEKSDLVGGL